MLSFGRVEGVSQPSKKDSLIGVEIKKNPMQVWLSSLSPCCLKPGDRRCLQTGGRGCLLSKVRYELVLVSERTCEFSRQAFSRSLVQFKQRKDRLDCSLVLLPLGVKTFLTGVHSTSPGGKYLFPSPTNLRIQKSYVYKHRKRTVLIWQLKIDLESCSLQRA